MRSFYGFEGRGTQNVKPCGDATYENAESARTKNNTKRLEKTAQNDPELAAVIAAWPELPEAIRAGIVAMVRAAKGV